MRGSLRSGTGSIGALRREFGRVPDLTDRLRIAAERLESWIRAIPQALAARPVWTPIGGGSGRRIFCTFGSEIHAH